MLKYNQSKDMTATSEVSGKTIAIFLSTVALNPPENSVEYLMRIVDINLYKLNIEIVAQDFQRFCHMSLNGVI